MGMWLLLHIALCSSFMAALLVPVHGQDPNPDFISIDCGAPNDYNDSDVGGIYYRTDVGFVDSGKNMQISSEYLDQNIRFYAKNVRVFPDGIRNCYTLQPNKGKGNKYLIRASFYYANYDNKNHTPMFDLYIGVDYWATIDTVSFIYEEIIYVPKTDDIQVCLVNTGKGEPFISALELRLLDNKLYQLDSGYLILNWRYDIGSSMTYRYPTDVFDRIWSSKIYGNGWTSMNTSSTSSVSDSNNTYRVPAEVLSTAQRVADANTSMDLFWTSKTTDKQCIYFHFAEIEKLQSGQQRELAISVNGKSLETSAKLEYLKPVTIFSGLITGPSFNFSITATNKSVQYPPILNAVESYVIREPLNVPTISDDVGAINDIKKVYEVNRVSWQGDPCVPNEYIWEGLNCSYVNPPRIMSLDLSSSKLTGEIAAPFSTLLALGFLNLSNNQFTGPIPEFLAKLPSLKILDLSGNNLSGSVPESLQKKIDDKTLQLSVANNPNLCLQDSCKPKKKHSFLIPVIAASSGLVALLLIAFAVIWRNRRNRGVTGQAKETIKAKNRPFTYNEVMKITDNFKTVIGEGGFGKVYLGILANGTKVAVKMLSQTSKQGFKEFQAEAQLLMIVHHRNLVSLVGYCDDAKNMALIYELMEKGDLRQHLSNNSIDSQVLTWNERLRIAIDAAQGLDYLHNGCKPPIIHRDLKTPNILLNENMQAKIADFGLSKAFAADNVSNIITRPAGTLGYLDPEFHSSGSLNRKSDVYSFGIILFELITGYPPVIRSSSGNVHLLQWVTPIIERGDIRSIVDPRLDGNFDVNSAWKLVEIAMACVPPTAVQRPDISRVLAELKECWTKETEVERSQRIGSSKRRSTGSFEMTSVEVDCDSLPYAR